MRQVIIHISNSIADSSSCAELYEKDTDRPLAEFSGRTDEEVTLAAVKWCNGHGYEYETRLI